MPESGPSEDTIELQIKITYLEEMLQEVNQVVYKQQLSIDKLEKQVEGLTSKVKEMGESTSGGDLPHEKPPHY